MRVRLCIISRVSCNMGADRGSIASECTRRTSPTARSLRRKVRETTISPAVKMPARSQAGQTVLSRLVKNKNFARNQHPTWIKSFRVHFPVTIISNWQQTISIINIRWNYRIRVHCWMNQARNLKNGSILCFQKRKRSRLILKFPRRHLEEKMAITHFHR
jgi:hypothetical protein